MASIRYSGPAEMTENGLEVMAFHLHRFLAGWLEPSPLDKIWVTVGFEGTSCASATFCVELTGCSRVDVGWTFEDLCHTYRRGDSRLHIERPDGALALASVPILDRPAMGGEARVALGFVLLPDELDCDEMHVSALQTRTYESICAARRNAMRLFFDDHRAMDMKSFLYAFLEQLPEWTGCDYAASMILTSSLETMTLEDVPFAQFDILAERTFSTDSSAHPQRLVGMTIQVEDAGDHVLASAFERQRADADLPYQIFTKKDGRWECVDTGSICEPFHAVRDRDDESMLVLVPLVARDGLDAELIGFLGLTWRERAELSSSAGQILADFSENLSPVLRHSSLYSLGAHKLWVLRRIRLATERALAERTDRAPGGSAIEDLIGVASELIESHVDVPSFGIAYLRGEPEGRVLRYVHARGWAKPGALELLVDVPRDQRTDSAVSTLAVRLNKPLVLAGGYGEGQEFGFKNSLFVHEDSGRVCDVRSGILASAEPGWVALSDYYKPARDRAYATLAYPITFNTEPIGVLTIEVDKATDWRWWTGFGGHLFWQMLASELANALYVLRS